MSPAPLLSIRNLRHRYGETTALDDVSIDIGENEFFALLGPSGCGKTTLLRAIAGFEHPHEGEIFLDGRSLLDVPANRRPINLMFQSYALFPHMSVERNIAYGLESEGLPRAEVRARVEEVIETVGLGSFARRRPTALSGGQRQRVALARAIVKRPRLLLLDEPLSALDRQVRAEMQLELKRLQHEVGLTFVVVTHDQEEAMSMADRIAVLDHGRVRQVDAPSQLYANPADLFVAAFIGTSTRFAGTLTATGIDTAFGAVPGDHSGAVGEPGALVVRPEDVHLGPVGSGRVDGVVIDTTFHGGASSVRLELDGGLGVLTGTVHADRLPARGERLGADWSAERARIVAVEPAPTAQGAVSG
ncbi:ABC transporter ATP-binding protein [Microcella frigidaquae]|uniref:Spermidine/putrescine transport system ATP-binding protein/putrescine transport system ATP-binding protein n=1 Tax=Microcella frigidaquae TaxID=424758 RepID=A0A840XJ55_9MICO|nr:ABC transporter ATP-binding protein [Microcella frigidaquae]MBB5616708.1 spermidine/putrescine transport system ATP-binding protein/putrescine transport system ATP-binding protein [Microcella frigidaquae]NHN43850.1 ABC transporter ATP-binding protein [Microcella frigidaquae]